MLYADDLKAVFLHRKQLFKVLSRKVLPVNVQVLDLDARVNSCKVETDLPTGGVDVVHAEHRSVRANFDEPMNANFLLDVKRAALQSLEDNFAIVLALVVGAVVAKHTERALDVVFDVGACGHFFKKSCGWTGVELRYSGLGLALLRHVA